jgi:hypothetical protein
MAAWPNPSDVVEIFSQEIAGAGGQICGLFQDDACAFVRSVLPPSIDVAAGDKLKGGVALRATDEEISVHPYVFRLVCTNGAIMAQAIESVSISREESFLGEDVETSLRCAVQACARPEAFANAANQMRSAKHSSIDMAINLAPFFSTHRQSIPAGILAMILQRFDRDKDRSAYGLMNAVTSVARDTTDPETKWRLESLGGSIPALKRRPRSPTPTRRREAALAT